MRMMQESPKTVEEETTGSYYYDDATGYEKFDPDAPDEEGADGAKSVAEQNGSPEDD